MLWLKLTDCKITHSGPIHLFNRHLDQNYVHLRLKYKLWRCNDWGIPVNVDYKSYIILNDVMAFCSEDTLYNLQNDAFSEIDIHLGMLENINVVQLPRILHISELDDAIKVLEGKACPFK